MSFLKRLGDAAREIGRAVTVDADPDTLLIGSMAATIELAATRYAVDAGAQWSPGQPLKLLLAGYAGTRNTGADVRVEEMIRQFRHLFGDDNLELGITTFDPEKTAGYFPTVRQIFLPKLFPKFLYDTVHQYHGVVSVEGSMFKSKFANALSTMMAGALGLAVAEDKLAIGYGGEAGAMDPALENLIRRYCRGAYVIARNDNSQEIMSRLGILVDSGTDTAWTFAPAPPEVGEGILREHGWDGVTPVVALCPINPFWWPVKPDLTRGVSHALTGAHGHDHNTSIYFHRAGDDVDEAQARYIEHIATAVRAVQGRRDIFPVCFGSEMLDRYACEALSERLDGAPCIVSDDYDMFEMVSVLRASSAVISSRYHAIVTSMPGLVPSAGITMDERIRNLMADRGQPHLALEVDDPQLGEHLVPVLMELLDEPDRVKAGIQACVVTNLERMGRMGQMLVEHVRTKHPEFPFREELGMHGDVWAHLPELPAEVKALL